MRELLERIFREAVRECHGGALVRGIALPERFHLLGAGKASAAMAQGLPKERISSGHVVTKDGHALPLEPIECVCAAHPIPDARSEAAGREALARAARLDDNDELVVLLSGGASALWAVPAPGLSLEDKQKTTLALLRAGCDITAINTVRKHLSAIKGGRLAAACRARITVLVLSDVLSDALDVIGSGPCTGDPTTAAEALAIARAVPGVPARVVAHLATPDAETPKRLAREPRTSLVGHHETLRQAAVRAAARAGRRAVLLPVASDDVSACAERLASLPPAGPDRVYIGGGEPTVVVRGHGRGGRAQQLALEVARRVRGVERVFLCAGSDGSDGPTDAAGAVVDGTTWDTAVLRGLDPERALVENDAYRVHQVLGSLVVTGPTGTNLGDLFLLA